MNSTHTAATRFAQEFVAGVDLQLVQTLAPTAIRILDADCHNPHTAEILKPLTAGRQIFGVSRDAQFIAHAKQHYAQIAFADIERDELPWEAASFDSILISQALHRSADPRALLIKLRGLLKANGQLVLAWPNMQHWQVLNQVLRGDLQANASSSFSTHTRHFLAQTNLLKLLLDAGFLPRIANRRLWPAPEAWLEHMRPTAYAMGYEEKYFNLRITTYEFFISAQPINNLPSTDHPAKPISVGVCTNKADILHDNLLASPCLTHHEIHCIEGAHNAADALNAAIAQSCHELIVLAHQDVYLPTWWIHRLWQQYALAQQATAGRIGVLGVYGVRGTPEGITHAGRLCDRDFLLDETTPLPAPVSSLDELLLIVPKNSPLRFDPALGFHLYGTDICLSAQHAGLHALVIDAPCLHNSQQGDVLPPDFARSKAVLKQKWASQLPIAAVCGLVY